MCCPHHEPWTSSVSHSSKKVLEQSFTLTDTRPVNIVLSFEFETGSIRGVTFTPLSVYRQEIQRKFFSGRQHFQLLGNCLLVMQNHSSGFFIHNCTTKQKCAKKKETTRLCSRYSASWEHCLLLKITLHQNPNQTHGCKAMYDCYLWVHSGTVQASCAFYHSLQHFTWGCACHVEATSLHRVPELICFISVFQNQ